MKYKILTQRVEAEEALQPLQICQEQNIHPPQNWQQFEEQQQQEGEDTTSQQQQQQQQVPPTDELVIDDPFKDIDLDLLDDASRAAVEKSRKTMSDMAGRVKTARTMQSKADSLQAENQKLLQQLQGHQQQQQQNLTPEATQVATLTPHAKAFYQEFRNGGMKHEDALNFATMQGKAIGQILEANNHNTIRTLAPIIETSMDAHVDSCFTTAADNDTMGVLSEEKVAQEVYDRAKQLAGSGQQVTPQIIAALGRSIYLEKVQNGEIEMNLNFGGGKQQQQQQQMNQNLPPNFRGNQGNLRGNGGGPSLRMPMNRGNDDGLDASTAAAIAKSAQAMAKSLEFGTGRPVKGKAK